MHRKIRSLYANCLVHVGHMPGWLAGGPRATEQRSVSVRQSILRPEFYRGSSTLAPKGHLMKSKCFPVLLSLTMLPAFAASGNAQSYCANFNNGMQTCGIPTLESCRETISGVGGSCAHDETSRLPPNLLQRLERDNPGSPLLPPNAPSAQPNQQPGGLNWMPPPPAQ